MLSLSGSSLTPNWTTSSIVFATGSRRQTWPSCSCVEPSSRRANELTTNIAPSPNHNPSSLRERCHLGDLDACRRFLVASGSGIAVHAVVSVGADLAVLGEVDDEVASVAGDQRLERRAGTQRAVASERPRRQGSVQQAVGTGGVLAEVHDPGRPGRSPPPRARIGRGRRSGVGFSLFSGVGGIDLEHEAVVLGEHLVAGVATPSPRTSTTCPTGSCRPHSCRSCLPGSTYSATTPLLCVELGGRGASDALPGSYVTRRIADDVELVIDGQPLLAVAHEIARAVDLEQSGAVEGVGKYTVGARERLARIRSMIR